MVFSSIINRRWKMDGGQLLSYWALAFATIDPSVITWRVNCRGVNCRSTNLDSSGDILSVHTPTRFHFLTSSESLLELIWLIWFAARKEYLYFIKEMRLNQQIFLHSYKDRKRVNEIINIKYLSKNIYRKISIRIGEE